MAAADGVRWRRALCALVLAACETTARPPEPGPLAAVTRELSAYRPFAASLHGSVGYVPCALPDSEPFAVVCQGPVSSQLVDGLRRATAEAAVTGASSSDAAWAGALVDLTFASDQQRVNAALRVLEELALANPGDPRLLNDLAVAYLVRGEHTRAASDVFMALDLFERAVQLPEAAPEVAFNRALVTARAGLLHATRQALRAGANEADWREELQQLTKGGTPLANESNAYDSAAVRRNPQGAREYAVDVLIPAWAAAVERRDLASSRLLRDSVERIGTLIAQQSGDSTVAHSAIEAARVSSRAPGSLALAWRESQAASAALGRQSFDSAAQMLRSSVQRLGSDAPTLALPRQLLLAFIGMRTRSDDVDPQLFVNLARRARASDNIYLAARTHWMHALYLSEGKRDLGGAEREYGEATRLFEQIGEGDNRQAMLSQRALVLSQMGQDAEALDAALESVRPHDLARSPRRTWEALSALGRMLSDVELPAAARVVHDEALRVAPLTGRAGDRFESMLDLAQALAESGEAVSSDSLLHAASAFVSTLAPAERERAEADYALTTARLALGASASDAFGLLQASRRYFEQQGNDWRLTEVRWQAARLALARGDTADGVSQLDSLADQLTRPAAGNSTESHRRQMAIRRNLMEQRLLVRLAQHDTLRALRAYAQLLGHDGRDAETFLTTLVPGQHTAVAFAVTASRLVIWTKRGGQLFVREEAITRDSLARLADRLVRRTRYASDLATSVPAEDSLQRLLLGDATLVASEGEPLVLLTDGVLNQLPFAALRSGGKWLIEQHALRFAESLGGLVAMEQGVPQATSQHAVVVGAPAHDPQLFPELVPLRFAEGEAERVSAVYGGSFLLTGRAATRQQVVQSLQGAALLHFAGHASVSPVAPERSHLVLGTSGGNREDNVLTGTAIRQMDLRRLALAVLSSCGTQSRVSSRVADVQGLSRAFLDAGTHAVVSSLWELDDAGASPLMVAFHGNVLKGMSASEAMAGAQREAIRGGMVGVRTWGAFRVDTR